MSKYAWTMDINNPPGEILYFIRGYFIHLFALSLYTLTRISTPVGGKARIEGGGAGEGGGSGVCKAYL
jgi:hypothetical protein